MKNKESSSLRGKFAGPLSKDIHIEVELNLDKTAVLTIFGHQEKYLKSGKLSMFPVP